MDFKKSEVYSVIKLNQVSGCNSFNVSSKVKAEKDFKIAVLVEQGDCSDYLKTENAARVRIITEFRTAWILF